MLCLRFGGVKPKDIKFTKILGSDQVNVVSMGYTLLTDLGNHNTYAP